MLIDLTNKQGLVTGIVMGATVPIILTSRGSDDISRKASCAMALVYVRNKEKFINRSDNQTNINTKGLK